MVAIAQHLRLPPLSWLRQACQETFKLRETNWPPAMKPPPAIWEGAWRGFVRDYGLPHQSLEDAYAAIRRFWKPVFDTTRKADDQSQWNADTWA